MGTTVTTNLSLIKPDTAESIKATGPFVGWPAQNSANCDVLDALWRASTHTWTPTWTASVNPTLGATGFVEGKYIRLWPRMVVGFLRLYTGGAGFATGTGGYNFTVPVAMDSSLTSFASELCIGKAIFYDDSAAATSSAFQVMYSTSGGTIFLKQPTNDAWTAASPVTLAQQDRLSAFFMYPTQAV